MRLAQPPSFFGDTGPLVAPGDYTASLYATVNGKTSELSESVNFKVKPLHIETVSGGVSPEQRSALLLNVENLRRQVSMASGQVGDLQGATGIV